jgi:transcriptional regulator with XRE-family HTH domain
LPFCKISLKVAKPTPYPQEPQTLGDHFKKRRYDLSLFQKEVALRLSVNVYTIRKWENNKTTPAVCYLPRIIEFLGYDPFPPPQCFGEEIAAVRRRLGISQKRLAKKLRMDEATLARVERGASKAKGKHLTALTALISNGSGGARKPSTV